MATFLLTSGSTSAFPPESLNWCACGYKHTTGDHLPIAQIKFGQMATSGFLATKPKTYYYYNMLISLVFVGLFPFGIAYAFKTDCQLQDRFFTLSDSPWNHFTNERPGETCGNYGWLHEEYLFT